MKIIKCPPPAFKTVRMRTGLLLRAMGLPRRCRWPQAAKRIKTYLIEARRLEDMDLASELSNVAAFLKRNLPRECAGCGKTIKPQSIKCKACE